MPTANSKQSTELEDLSVKEVSVVDRPANKKKFLIVKRDNNLEIIRTEEIMPRNAIPAKDVVKTEVDKELLNAIAAAVNKEGEENTTSTDTESKTDESVNKLSEAVKACIAELTKLSETVKSETDITDEVTQKVSDLVNALKTIMEKGEETTTETADTEKAVPEALAGALQMLMGIAEKLDGMEDAMLSDEMKMEMEKVIAMLGSLMKAPEEGEAAPAEEMEANTEEKNTTSDVSKFDIEGLNIEVQKNESDPEVTFKAGAKMAKVRLSKLRDVIKTLDQLLTELEHRDEAEKRSVTKEEEVAQRKLDDEFINKIKTLMEDSASKLGEKIEEVSKRVEKIEGITPAGSTIDPPATEVKKSDNIWSGFLGLK